MYHIYFIFGTFLCITQVSDWLLAKEQCQVACLEDCNCEATMNKDSTYQKLRVCLVRESKQYFHYLNNENYGPRKKKKFGRRFLLEVFELCTCQK